MILVLTYHKVLRDAGPKPAFYTITGKHLEAQLEELARSGISPLSPEDLLAYPARREPAYVLSFDDGTVDHYEVVLPLLTQYRLKAMFFVPTARLNRTGYLTSGQAAELSRVGHTLGLHGHEHRRLDRLQEEDIRVQMEASRRVLTELEGRPPVFFAPVGGYIDRRVQRLALEAGARVIRTMRWGYNRRLKPSAVECVPVNRFFTEKEFGRVLKFRNRSLDYALKQAAKKLIPGAAYERLRERVFGRGRRG